MDNYSDIVDQIADKYKKMGQNPEVYLKGLLHANTVNYWDYIEVDTLLSLQKPRTDFPDEMVFIMYHQVTELLLNMMLHEIHQICEKEAITTDYFITKLGRINRYIQMLANSFDVMRLGMDPAQYNQFRLTLTPASGLQSASFREVEICTTDIENLVDARTKNNLPETYDFEYLFENIYWQAAGKNYQTGKKTLTLQAFEKKYLSHFIKMAQAYQSKNVWRKYLSMPTADRNDPNLIQAMKDLDIEFNIKWPLVHLTAAKQYLESEKKVTAATGGSEWQKYLHPKYQRRVFFPGIWTEDELSNWAQEY